MPCDRCGARQVDPPRGPSLWKRGVRGGRQVLVCPECQGTSDWSAELDHCPACSSAALVRMLGATHCRACGSTVDSAPDPAVAPSVPDEALRDEVQAALDRVLRGRTG